MSEDFDSIEMREASEYLFLLRNVEKIQFVTREYWIKSCYETLDKIAAEEDYLHFRMKEPINDQLSYYRDNVEELEDIITIINPEYAASAYHSILNSILETDEGIKNNLDLEYLIVVEQLEDEELVGYFAFPKNFIKEIKLKKEEYENDTRLKNEGMFV